MEDMQLKEAIEQINISEAVQQEMIQNLRRQEEQGRYRYHHKPHSIKRSLPAVAAILLAVGIVSIPVQAGIRYLIKERMESIPKEEMEETLEMQKEQTNGADLFSREYSPNEKQRMEALFRDYQNGIFPERQLLIVEEEEQVTEDTLCYLESTGCFYLPDRELTDEEILEIIEFNYKREYALTLDPEVQAVIENHEKEQNEIKTQVQAGGGISEAEAVAVAQEWMNTFFGVSTDGMEEIIYLDEEWFDVPTYHITYEIQSVCYYYFSISTVDGSIMYISVSIPSMRNTPRLTEEQAKERTPQGRRDAQRFLEEQLGIHEEYKAVYAFYIAENGELLSSDITYFFEKTDGNFDQVAFYYDTNGLSGYTCITRELFEQQKGWEGAVVVPVDLEN